jgi:lysophospholipase L1-like esterase
MKTMMCFGDSITWGQDPETRQRIAQVAIAVGSLINRAQRSGCGRESGAPQVLVIAPHKFGAPAPMERL